MSDEYPPGSTAKKYLDSEGNECSLRMLVYKEKEWAVNIIRHYEKKVAAQTAMIASLEKLTEEQDKAQEALHKSNVAQRLKLEAQAARIAELEEEARISRDIILTDKKTMSEAVKIIKELCQCFNIPLPEATLSRLEKTNDQT